MGFGGVGVEMKDGLVEEPHETANGKAVCG